MSDLHVVFGTGPVGRAVMRELLGRGKKVRMVNRGGAASLPAGVELLVGDAADRRFCRTASAGAAVVYQCLNPPYERWPELFPRLQAGVLEGAATTGAKLVSMENVYLYGSTFGKPITEKRPTTAMTRKGRVRAEMAEALMQAHAKGRVRVAIGRASDFFGPEVLHSAMGSRVFGPALTGKPAAVLGTIDLLHTYSYVPDIGRGLVLLGQRDEALGEAWHLPSPETFTTREFLRKVYAETGYPLQVRRAGKAMVRFLGFFKPQVRELAEMMYQFTESFVVEHTKFVEVFGDISTPLPEAIRTTVEWYRAQAERTDEGSAETRDEQEEEETKDHEPGVFEGSRSEDAPEAGA